MAEVTTAIQLDAKQRDLVKRALERMTGKTILLETRIQPGILGGVVARVGDKLIDGSVERRLKSLQQQLLTGVATASIDFFAETAREEALPSGDGSQPAHQPKALDQSRQ